MNRDKKVALLKKLLQEGASQVNRQQLQQATGTAPPPFMVVVYDLVDCHQTPIDTTPVRFYDRGQDYSMTWIEAKEYANQNGIKTTLIMPDGGHLPVSK